MMIMLAYARVALVFYLLPVTGGKMLSNPILKNTVIFLTLIGLWPCLGHVVDPEQGWVLLLTKEALLGLMLAMVLCLPFWIANAMGELFDNQRGATISESIDPVNGLQSSTMSAFLGFIFGAIFLAQGGMELLLDALVKSYQLIPPGSPFLHLRWLVAGKLIQILGEHAIVMAAPVMMTMMLSEIMLGVFARYCPQLNPFSLSMSFKSFIAFSIFLLYGHNVLSHQLFDLFSLTHFYHFIGH
ncbi:type III secretion system export apparatus subunit SctT [Enterobacter sp. 22466]|uniref:type III secretion system export apparatus subunit SctT n=1 Tax=Enterobacter sp. 22466 TaxID=3453924 RepID=UPI003F85F662